jgi:hypothetical protein
MSDRLLRRKLGELQGAARAAPSLVQAATASMTRSGMSKFA